MKKTKLTTLAIAGMLSLSVALTACGGGGGETPGGGETTGGGSGGGGGDQTLTVWAWDPAFNIYSMQEAEKIYQKDHPDFKLDIQETPWNDIQTRLTTIAQAQTWDELPDIFLMQNNSYQKNIINYPDIAQPLTDTGIPWDEFPEGVKAYSTIDGDNSGVPFDAGTAVTAMRIDVLEEAGYTIKDLTDITWTRFIEIGKDVLAKTGKPLLSGEAGSPDLIMMMLQSAGASMFAEDGSVNMVDNPALSNAVDIYIELVKSGVLTQINSWDEYIGTLTNSTVAGAINGIWIIASIQTAEDQSGKWMLTNLPKLDVDGATHYSANGGSSWAVSKNGDLDLAVDFLKSTFGSSVELYDDLLPNAGAISSYLPAAESDVYNQPSEFYGGQTVYKDIVEFAGKVPAFDCGAYYSDVRSALTDAVTNIVQNNADIDSEMQNAQDTVEFNIAG